MKKFFHLIPPAASLIILFFCGCRKRDNIVYPNSSSYPIHKNITSTYFWIGVPADTTNAYVGNAQSSWDINWQAHYGGYDDPIHRNGYYPVGFIPKENPFYFALPYDDYDENGNRRQSAYNMIYWAKEKTWLPRESMCKNQWIKIWKGEKIVYAQWEDSGPFFYDDSSYVFGISLPRNQFLNNSSGIDVSPAVRDYLGLAGLDTVSWQFVNPNDVPYGVWKFIVTISQVDWGQSKKY